MYCLNKKIHKLFIELLIAKVSVSVSVSVSVYFIFESRGLSIVVMLDFIAENEYNHALYRHLRIRSVAQLGSAPQWGCGGRRFKSSRSDHS